MKNNILRPNGINILLKSPDDNPILKIQGHFIKFVNILPAVEKKLPLPNQIRRRILIKANISIVVKAETAQNIGVRFKDRPLSIDPENPVMVILNKNRENFSIGMYKRVIRSLISIQQKHFPFVNLGTADIRINKSEILNYLKTASII